MNLQVPWLIGLRYSASRTGGVYLSFISRVSLLGLALGVVALTVVVSVMNGFDQQLRYRILGAVPHVTASADSRQSMNAMQQWLQSQPGVTGAAEFMQRQGMIIGPSRNRLVALYGIDPDQEHAVSIVGDHIVEGQLSALKPGTNHVFMGRALAYQLGVYAGQELTLVIPEATASGNAINPRLAKVRVAGLFSLGSELDYELVLMSLADLQGITGDRGHGLRAQLQDVFTARLLSKQLRQQFPSGVTVNDWTDDYGDFFETVKMEKVMMFILLVLIVAIAAFNIVSGLSMMVKEKAGDIAVLRTMGLSERQVMLVFVFQGSLIGAAGVILGVLIGVPLAAWIPEIVGFFEGLLGGQVLAGTYFSRVPTDIRWPDIALIVMVSFGISVLATLYPALQAARLRPAQVLRHE